MHHLHKSCVKSEKTQKAESDGRIAKVRSHGEDRRFSPAEAFKSIRASAPAKAGHKPGCRDPAGHNPGRTYSCEQVRDWIPAV